MASPASAANSDKLAKQLEKLNADIQKSRTLAGNQQVTLDELRQDLYRAAVTTRDAKRLSDEIEQLRARGLLVDVELAQLRGDILNAGVLLRDLRDRIEILAQIHESTRQIMDGQSDDIARLRNAVVDPEEATRQAGAELVASLQKQLDAAKRQAAEKDRQVERLTHENRALKGGAPRAVTTPVVTGTGYDNVLERANNELAAGKIEEASLSFKQALTLDPESENARTGLAACHFERGELDAARRLVDEVLTKNDKNTRALGLRGALAFRNGELRDARRILERAVKADKDDPYNLNYLGIVFHALGRHDNAIKNIKKAVERDPDYVSALYNLSILLATDRRPDFDSAREHYQRALTLGSPRNPSLDQILGLSGN